MVVHCTCVYIGTVGRKKEVKKLFHVLGRKENDRFS